MFGLPRPLKRGIQILFDCVLIIFCFWVALALRLDGLSTKIELISWANLAVVVPATIFVFLRLGLYNIVVRYIAERAASKIVLGSFLSSVVMLSSSQYLELHLPRSVPGIYFSILIVVVFGVRSVIRTIYFMSRSLDRQPVAIYGAGDAGRLLLRSLQDSDMYNPKFLIDDDKTKQGTFIAGTPVLSLTDGKKRLLRNGISLVLIAKDDGKVQNQSVKNLVDMGIEVRIIPEMADVISGRVKISNMRQMTIQELLGRSPVLNDPKLMGKTIKGKSVLVTGAGGSIGSELSRQILGQMPQRLVLLDVSEYALYTIIEDLSRAELVSSGKVDLVAVLGSVTDKDIVLRTIAKNNVETVYHAAAYKHVPLTEQNPAEAIRNNVHGTHVIVQAAGQQRVKYFTLVSSDKAVRPTNIMGATKRLGELVMQAAVKQHPYTNYCAVRFGNVLGSSGSVVPKFEKQISSGGPITLTHPSITRYFMTIPEAAQLVIQAAAMAGDGKIFVLDMGKPVQILDLAKKMCTLFGKKAYLKNEKLTENEAPSVNSIEIKIVGLRSGEKLHEELFLTGDENATQHDKIRYEKLDKKIKINIDDEIKKLLDLTDYNEIVEALTRLPLGYYRDFHK